MKAKEALQEAKLLGESHHWNTSANRLYYACFYIVTAYLVMNNLQASTHKGVKIAFNQELIRSRRIGSEFGRLYNDLLNLRLDADYRDFNNVAEEVINPLIVLVTEFINEMEAII